jgi:hypothetical protein
VEYSAEIVARDLQAQPRSVDSSCVNQTRPVGREVAAHRDERRTAWLELLVKGDGRDLHYQRVSARLTFMAILSDQIPNKVEHFQRWTVKRVGLSFVRHHGEDSFRVAA